MAKRASSKRVDDADESDVGLLEPTSRHVEEWKTPGGILVQYSARPRFDTRASASLADLRLHIEHTRLSLLRGFDELLCLEGLSGVEHLPHQIETVRKVLRQFRGRVLLADEVGLGKTIEACLLLREYLLRGLAKRVLILVPSPLVSQWQEELSSKFQLDFTVPPRTTVSDKLDFWKGTDRVLASLSFVKSKKRAELVASAPWDLVIVDEAHHCKNRTTLNWQVINSLQRRFMFLLTATPVQNDLVELYNLLTLLSPGHLKTEAAFKKQFVSRGNPRDPRNRERLRDLLGEVMIRNTRSLVSLDLPPRYAQTIVAQPEQSESLLYEKITDYLRKRGSGIVKSDGAVHIEEEPCEPMGVDISQDGTVSKSISSVEITRMQLSSLLAAQGSHPKTLAASLDRLAAVDADAAQMQKLANEIGLSAKDERFLQIVKQSEGHKILVFVNFRRTVQQLGELLTEEKVPFVVFSGEQSAAEKDLAVDAFRDRVNVMLCTDAGAEGRNLQFADTLVNYDLPWNPMKIEQRIGRVHRYGQKRDVFIFNLCTKGSLEARILHVLSEKIRMFELVVGEVSSILGNLDDGDQFESLVLNLWLKSQNQTELESSFESLAESLLEAQADYLATKELDEALFGEDYQ